MTATSNFKKHTSKNFIQQFLLSKYYQSLVSLFPKDVKTVLDVGCGEGFVIPHLPANVSYLGLDFNSESLNQAQKLQSAIARKKNIKLLFAQTDISQVLSNPKHFDLVLCLEVMEHIKNFDIVLQALARLSFNNMILSVPNEPFFQLSNFLSGKYLSSWGNHPEHVNHWTTKAFSRLIEKYFTIVKKSYPFPWQIWQVIPKNR